MHPERGLLVNGTLRRHGKSRPASKNSGMGYEGAVDRFDIKPSQVIR